MFFFNIIINFFFIIYNIFFIFLSYNLKNFFFLIYNIFYFGYLNCSNFCYKEIFKFFFFF
ncbi:hypothetical protein [Candidatus Nasuia deltocephalinicola]|uniref:hypothetical protein n=1 Tax=Candidatus Nasuia deltocephalincola TaxID=1160784 RepID=UPI00216B26F6|nr:hypothetical protein [Candidatus Nasuia deltocephalinicola]